MFLDCSKILFGGVVIINKNNGRGI
jgi:hypothetical protein